MDDLLSLASESVPSPVAAPFEEAPVSPPPDNDPEIIEAFEELAAEPSIHSETDGSFALPPEDDDLVSPDADPVSEVLLARRQALESEAAAYVARVIADRAAEVSRRRALLKEAEDAFSHRLDASSDAAASSPAYWAAVSQLCGQTPVGDHATRLLASLSR
jgi:hypothetical protein